MTVEAEPVLWRCQECGRVSQAKRKPSSHRRTVDGEMIKCGPFRDWRVAEERSTRPVLPALTKYRQSLLRSFETCPRRTRFGLELPGDLTTGYTEASADLGKAVHAVNAEILRTLHQHGEEYMPTQEAVEIMYEVLVRADYVLPADEREALLGMTLWFVSKPWDTRRILGLEKRLSTEIACQDGVMRTLTGQPDLLVAAPPSTIIIVDYKSGWGRPKQPMKTPAEGEVVSGKQYLSDRGHYQLDSYGLLAMRQYPAVQEAVLRELHLRTGEVREAVLRREELEHVERELGLQMMLVERGIAEGRDSKVWKPRPGSHCLRQCPVARSCPIPTEQRGDGAVDDDSDADAQAERFAVVDAQRQQLRARLKAYHEQTGYAAQVGDGKVMRWKGEVGDRSFGMHDPLTEQEMTERRARIANLEAEVVAGMEAELERRQAMAA